MFVVPNLNALVKQKNNNINNDNNVNNNIRDVEKVNTLKCMVTIIGDGKVRDVCLDDFNKNIITFGRSDNNDIILSSSIVSSNHGYFSINNGNVNIFDDRSKNGLFVNDMRCNNSMTLKNGDAIKIDNPDTPLSSGILMIITICEIANKWMEFSLARKLSVIIGRSNDCDIILDRVSISAKHAKITYDGSGYYISSFDNKSGVILNNSILYGRKLLKNKDIIVINNIRLIYNDNKIIYQKYDIGVRLDAIDVVKTVILKGKKKHISQHVDFNANSGEFIAFVGGSGAGKSTFLKCISGVTKPTSGKVLINGNDLFNNYSVLKNLIGYVPQDNIIFDDLTLGDMLKYSANLRMPDDATIDEKANRIKEVLDIVELADKKDVMIRNLSGGQQKRACIAVELLADPKLFFLDEPTSGLDPGTERSIMKTLRKMANSGKTIILVTHNTLNLHLCDKVVFFGYGGKVCFDGRPQDALTFFNSDDFVDIYNMLNADTDEWHGKFNKSSFKKNTDVKASENNYSHRSKRKSFPKQLSTLLLRRLKLLFNNKYQMLLLFGQAPLIALLFSLVVTDELFYSYEETKSILFAIATASIWIGLLNSIQEVCKERVILEKEFMADLRVGAYLTSKVVYLLLLSLLQAILFVGAFVLIIDVPQNGLLYAWYIESIVVVFLTIFSSSSLGLAVSSISKDSSVALTMPTLLLIPQILYSGMLFPLEGMVEKVSNFILCRWSVEALGTVNDLNSLISEVQAVIPGFVREVETYYTFTINHLTYDLAIIGLMTIILIIVSYYFLKSQLESGR